MNYFIIVLIVFVMIVMIVVWPLLNTPLAVHRPYHAGSRAGTRA